MVALVTGGASGLGLGVTHALAHAGQDVVVVGRTPESDLVEALQETRTATSATISYVSGDVAAATDVETITQAVREVDRGRSEPLHLVHGAVMANQVAQSSPAAALSQITAAMSVNAFPLLTLTHALDDLLVPGSAVTLLTSEGVRRVVDGYVSVAASKASAEALIRYLAVELGPRGIRCNSVSSGPILTTALRAVWPGADEHISRIYRRSPLRTPVRAEDVGNLVAFLGSTHARAITGQTLLVDSGIGLMP